MNIWVVIPLVLILIGLRFSKVNALAWLAIVWVSIWVLLSFGIQPPVPSSIATMYMAIITVALTLYGTSSQETFTEIRNTLASGLTNKKRLPIVLLLAFVAPAYMGFSTYRAASKGIQAPASGRTIHPAPPGDINFGGKKIDLINGTNPYRELERKNPEEFKTHLANGKSVYYRNCIFCHGDDMGGDGHFAHGFEPIPANFQDPGTIAMLQESYLFWRIAKGGPGLPEEGTPWLTVMPAWEGRLSEDQIWEVILFLYDFTGRKPRAKELHE